ncbi:unnamed protein product [Macrosiphum euphorbiae]|nr:unnamed protein product [Macrosiphum euphorbiae]
MTWNCNGIRKKTQELTAFVKLHNIHVILLSETRLHPKTQLKIPNFHIYRSDRKPLPRHPPNGGTAVLIRRGIMHNHVNVLTELDSTSAQIKIENEITQVTAVYKSPSATLKSSDLDALTKHHGPLIIGGDLNAKHTDWHSLRSNKSGKTLAQHAESSNRYSIVASDSPTYFSYVPTHRPDVLDIFLLDTPNWNYFITNLCDFLLTIAPRL